MRRSEGYTRSRQRGGQTHGWTDAGMDGWKEEGEREGGTEE